MDHTRILLAAAVTAMIAGFALSVFTVKYRLGGTQALAFSADIRDACYESEVQHVSIGRWTYVVVCDNGREIKLAKVDD